MDNWFLREAGAKSSTPFHHEISYFDVDGTMCILWLIHLGAHWKRRRSNVAWVKGSHLWNKIFLRVRFTDGHKVEGKIIHY